MPTHKPPGTAEAKERAGFMLIPEIGASKVMKRNTSAPANRPVYLASLCRFVTKSTVDINPKEITVSAAKAGHGPAGPGVVATKEMGGRRKRSCRVNETNCTPARPPIVCEMT